MVKTRKKQADLLPGGLADDMPDSDFDSEQLDKGIDVEKEHTNDPAKAKEIAKDHLSEFENYYKSLPKMEKKLEKTGNDDSWVQRVMASSFATNPPKKVFTQRAKHIADAAELEGVAPSLLSWLRMTQFHINRGGSRLPEAQRKELQKAVKIMSQRIKERRQMPDKYDKNTLFPLDLENIKNAYKQADYIPGYAKQGPKEESTEFKYESAPSRDANLNNRLGIINSIPALNRNSDRMKGINPYEPTQYGDKVITQRQPTAYGAINNPQNYIQNFTGLSALKGANPDYFKENVYSLNPDRWLKEDPEIPFEMLRRNLGLYKYNPIQPKSTDSIPYAYREYNPKNPFGTADYDKKIYERNIPDKTIGKYNPAFLQDPSLAPPKYVFPENMKVMEKNQLQQRFINRPTSFIPNRSAQPYIYHHEEPTDITEKRPLTGNIPSIQSKGMMKLNYAANQSWQGTFSGKDYSSNLNSKAALPGNEALHQTITPPKPTTPNTQNNQQNKALNPFDPTTHQGFMTWAGMLPQLSQGVMQYGGMPALMSIYGSMTQNKNYLGAMGKNEDFQSNLLQIPQFNYDTNYAPDNPKPSLNKQASLPLPIYDGNDLVMPKIAEDVKATGKGYPEEVARKATEEFYDKSLFSPKEVKEHENFYLTDEARSKPGVMYDNEALWDKLKTTKHPDMESLQKQKDSADYLDLVLDKYFKTYPSFSMHGKDPVLPADEKKVKDALFSYSYMRNSRERLDSPGNLPQRLADKYLPGWRQSETNEIKGNPQNSSDTSVGKSENKASPSDAPRVTFSSVSPYDIPQLKPHHYLLGGAGILGGGLLGYGLYRYLNNKKRTKKASWGEYDPSNATDYTDQPINLPSEAPGNAYNALSIAKRVLKPTVPYIAVNEALRRVAPLSFKPATSLKWLKGMGLYETPLNAAVEGIDYAGLLPKDFGGSSDFAAYQRPLTDVYGNPLLDDEGNQKWDWGYNPNAGGFDWKAFNEMTTPNDKIIGDISTNNPYIDYPASYLTAGLTAATSPVKGLGSLGHFAGSEMNPFVSSSIPQTAYKHYTGNIGGASPKILSNKELFDKEKEKWIKGDLFHRDYNPKGTKGYHAPHISKVFNDPIEQWKNFWSAVNAKGLGTTLGDSWSIN